MTIPTIEPAFDPTAPPDGEPRPSSGIGTIAAWAIILVMVGFMVLGRGGGSAPPTGPDGVVEVPSDDPVSTALLTIQGRYVIGVAHLANVTGGTGPGGGAGGGGAAASPIQPEQLYQQVATAVPTGPPQVRMRLAILAAELVGPEAGLDVLAQLEAAVAALDAVRPGGFTLEETDDRMLQDLRDHLAALASGAPGSLGPDERARLERELGWWGRLADVLGGTEAERGPVLAAATRSATVVLAGVAIVAIAGLCGLVLLLVAGIAAGTGRLSLVAPVTAAGRMRHGRLAEVFAVWMVLFIGLQVIGATLASGMNTGPAGQLGAAFLAFFVSLVALGWGPLRGLRPGDYATIAGLGRGRGVLREIGAGFVGYAATLPLLAVGLVATLLLAVAAGVLAGGGAGDDPVQALMPAGGPAHPIVGEIGRSGLVTLMVLLTGAVAAPIVEEIFFRGCLHSHLRHGLRRAGPIPAALAAAVTSAFLFAVIHPQGWIAVPALMSLAIGFSMVREWRRNLIAPVVMHAINNGGVLTLLTLLLM